MAKILGQTGQILPPARAKETAETVPKQRSQQEMAIYK